MFVGSIAGVAGLSFFVVSYDLPLTYTYWGGGGNESASYRANTLFGHLKNLFLGLLPLSVGVVSLASYMGIKRVRDIWQAATPNRLGVFITATLSYLLFPLTSVVMDIFRGLYMDQTGQQWVGIFAMNTIVDSARLGAAMTFLYGLFLMATSIPVIIFLGITAYLSSRNVSLLEKSPGITRSFLHFCLYSTIWIGIAVASFLLIQNVLNGDFLTPAVLVWSLYAALCLRAMEAHRARNNVLNADGAPTTA